MRGALKELDNCKTLIARRWGLIAHVPQRTGERAVRDVLSILRVLERLHLSCSTMPRVGICQDYAVAPFARARSMLYKNGDNKLHRPKTHSALNINHLASICR